MTQVSLNQEAPGPYRADDLRPGDRYELSHGHKIYCMPTGGDGANSAVTGAQVLATDPAVTECGFDAGYTPDSSTVRAPDLAVGNVPNRPGWVPGVPPLAVEYAGSGQDETDLKKKIDELLTAGTKQIWVVRLLGPRRVEVHEPGKKMRTVGPGTELTAPGILHNPVPVEALYDPAVARKLTLRNLLQREGYESLNEVREEGLGQGLEQGLARGIEQGREQGLVQGKRDVLFKLIARGGPELTAVQRQVVEECRDPATLDLWIDRALSGQTVEEILGGETSGGPIA